MSNTNSIKSPCVSICALDEHDICVGCYRSGEEITRWFSASDDDKKKIMQRVIEREKSSNNYIS